MDVQDIPRLPLLKCFDLCLFSMLYVGVLHEVIFCAVCSPCSMLEYSMRLFSVLSVLHGVC